MVKNCVVTRYEPQTPYLKRKRNPDAYCKFVKYSHCIEVYTVYSLLASRLVHSSAISSI